MSVAIAFISVILIWSTTPLAIQWSSEGWGYLFGVSSRMILGAVFGSLILALLSTKLPLHKKALQTYLAAGIGVFGAMVCVYWGAQYIPSGLIAVIFAMSPIVTSVLAAISLQESCFSVGKSIGMLLGFVGISIIFSANLTADNLAWQGIAALVFGVFLHAGSSVWVKRIDANLSGIVTASGTLVMMSPVYLITWYLFDGLLPGSFQLRSGLALIYLGLVGSVLGFSLYFYILKRVDTNQTALITLITPVFALVIGRWFNDEMLPAEIWFGTLVIITVLIAHTWGDNVVFKLKNSINPI